MPRTSSRKGSTNSTASGNSSNVDLFRSASGKVGARELERIDQFFNAYSSNASGVIDPEGIESLCSDLEVDHTDVRILMLAWKMQAARQGYFTLAYDSSLAVQGSRLYWAALVEKLILDEWRLGLKTLRADTIIKLKKALPDLVKEVRKPSNFSDFYAYSFRYCLTEEKQKSVDIESVCLLLDLVLGSQSRPQVDALSQYLKIQTDYKVINMDQWMGFYRFCNEVSFPDINNYDPDLAWPLILDNFVDWFQSKKGKV